MTIVSRACVALAAALLLAGCAARGVRVAELRDRPDRYDDKTIRVTGTVTNSWGVPLVPFQFYSVDDGTGEITVLSQRGNAPRKGAHVRVKGRINEVAVLGGRSIGLHIQEQDRRVD